MATNFITVGNLSRFLERVRSLVATAVAGKADKDHKHSADDVTSGTMSSDRLPVVPISKGGTGKTRAKAAANALLGGMSEEGTNVSDSSYLVFLYTSPSDGNGAVYKRRLGNIWEWIRSKISKDSQLVVPRASVAVNDGLDQRIDSTYVVSLVLSGNRLQAVRGDGSSSTLDLPSGGGQTMAVRTVEKRGSGTVTAVIPEVEGMTTAFVSLNVSAYDNQAFTLSVTMNDLGTSLASWKTGTSALYPGDDLYPGADEGQHTAIYARSYTTVPGAQVTVLTGLNADVNVSIMAIYVKEDA